jgi:hypothetical protein
MFASVLIRFVFAVAVCFLLSSLSTTAYAQKGTLYVFVGEKIELMPFDEGKVEGELVNDNAFKARYRVLYNVYGGYYSDTIEFEVHDHYGSPAFAEFSHVLLFVSEINGKFYHEKYQYFDVYKTRDGRWAGDGDPYKFDGQIEKSRRLVKPIPITFEKVVAFDLKDLDRSLIHKFYPAPYYKVQNQKAYALMGNYVEDLFLVKKEGVLKARGLF